MQETVPKKETSSVPEQVDQQEQRNAVEEQRPPTRVVPQPDRINNSLMSIFLGRINNDPEFSSFFYQHTDNSNLDSNN